MKKITCVTFCSVNFNSLMIFGKFFRASNVFSVAKAQIS